MKIERLDFIEEYMVDSWKNDWYKNGDHLHIDFIDQSLRYDKKQWFSQGLQYYNFSLALYKKHNFPFIIFLSFSLKNSLDPIGMCFENKQDLIEEVDDSPPSLYILDMNEKFYHPQRKLLSNKNEIKFLPDHYICYFSSFFYEPEKCYLRGLSIFKKGKEPIA